MNSLQHQSKKPRPALLLAACSRPNLLLPAWLSAGTGAALSGGTIPAMVPLTIVVAAFSLVLSAIHAANLIADRNSDKINGKNTFWQDHLPATTLARHGTGWAILGLLLSAWAHWTFLLPVASTLALGFAYSLPPARLSARWGWDLLANALGYGLLAPWWGAMVTHWDPSVSAPDLSIPWNAMALLVPLVSIVFFWTTILDVKGDRESGKNTLAVHFKLSRNRLRPFLVVGIFAGVIGAGIPGFLAYPTLIPICGLWFILAMVLTRRVKQFEPDN